MAAVLACGAGARLSHRSAAALWGIAPAESGRDPVEVAVPTQGGRASRAGIVVHRTRSALSARRHREIPVTSPEQTILDLAGTWDLRPLERVVDEAAYQGLMTKTTLSATLADAVPSPRARRLLRDLLADHELGSTLTRSELEELFLGLCRGAGLPAPRVNARLEGLTVDFFWAERGLVAETDGRRSHGTDSAFERDRIRDQRLAVAGYRVVRFTHRQITQEPSTVISVLKGVL